MPAKDQKKSVKVPLGKTSEKDKEEKSDSGAKKEALPGVVEEAELSPEDKELKENLELAVERVQDKEDGVAALALETIRKEIRSATSSMTSVPKPLKFLRPHYATMVAFYEGRKTGSANKKELADILSVLAMTNEPPEKRMVLKYKLQGNVVEISEWGSEYVRCLSGEVGQEFDTRTNNEDGPIPTDDLMPLIREIVPFHLQHNAEHDAVDLLIEVSMLDLLLTEKSLDKNNFERVTLYLVRTSDYMSDPEDLEQICLEIL